MGTSPSQRHQADLSQIFRDLQIVKRSERNCLEDGNKNKNVRKLEDGKETSLELPAAVSKNLKLSLNQFFSTLGPFFE